MNLTLKTIVYSDIPFGVSKCTLGSWNGIEYTIPRKLISKKNKIIFDISKDTCVYILSGEYNGDTAYYIGETEDLFKRIHDQHKEDWWNKVIIFTGKKESELNKAQIKYIESTLYEMAKINEKNKKFIVMNLNTPKKSTLDEFK